jgi:hypothetical protein
MVHMPRADSGKAAGAFALGGWGGRVANRKMHWRTRQKQCGAMPVSDKGNGCQLLPGR